VTYEERIELLDAVDRLGIHPQVAKLRGRTTEEEWEKLKLLVRAAEKAAKLKKPRGNTGS